MRDVAPRFRRDLYLHGFDRRNLWRGRALPTGKGSTAAYRSEGRVIFDACRRRADVVLLGDRIETIAIGQSNISQNQIERLFIDLVYRLLIGSRNVDLVTQLS